MKLSYNSWHARWYRWVIDRKNKECVIMPDNLCQYSFDLFMTMIIIPFFLTLLALISLLAVTLLCGALIGATVMHPIAILGIVAVALTVFFLGKNNAKFVVEYVKAKKENYCPRIEWENKEAE